MHMSKSSSLICYDSKRYFQNASGSIIKVILTGFTLLYLLSSLAFADSDPPSNLTGRERAEIIDSIAEIFAERYVYPETGMQIDSMLRSKLAAGLYDDLNSLPNFTQSIRDDLREFSNDLHIWLEPIPEDRFYVVEGNEITEEQIYDRSLENFGWKKLEWLPGAVGYIKVDRFDDVSYAQNMAETALSFMANCQAVIIDLREHHGGYDNMLQLVTSYFFSERTQLNGLYWTYLDSMQENWTWTDINGKPLYDKDLYLLTSNQTASGAEAFAYNLKHYGRAIIVGEQTAGAAHWSDWYEFPNLGIVVLIPVARPINPVTKTSWEGSGVIPDIKVEANKALDTAYLEAVMKIQSKTQDEKLQRICKWTIPSIQARLKPVVVHDELAARYVGNYRDVDSKKQYGISYENNNLVYNHYSGRNFILIPLTESLFTFEDDDAVRLQFLTDASGAATEFHLVDQSGVMAIRTRITE